MTYLIQSIFEKDNTKEAVSHRWSSLFHPIQSHTYKAKDSHNENVEVKRKSEFCAFLLTPFIDLLLIPVYMLDVAISLINAFLSLLETASLWALNQHKRNSAGIEPFEGNYYEGMPKTEYDARQEIVYNLECTFYSLLAVFNPLASGLSLFTRPAVSLVEAAKNNAGLVESAVGSVASCFSK